MIRNTDDQCHIHKFNKKGAPIEFSSKARFLASLGFDEALGINELNRDEYSQRVNSWGLPDPILRL